MLGDSEKPSVWERLYIAKKEMPVGQSGEIENVEVIRYKGKESEERNMKGCSVIARNHRYGRDYT